MFLLNVRDQVSHPYKTTENYTFLYFKMFFGGKWDGEAWTGLNWLRIRTGGGYL
jgi:hypothetical protein